MERTDLTDDMITRSTEAQRWASWVCGSFPVGYKVLAKTSRRECRVESPFSRSDGSAAVEASLWSLGKNGMKSRTRPWHIRDALSVKFSA